MNEKEMLFHLNEHIEIGHSIKDCPTCQAIRALIIRLADQFNIHCSGVGLSADDFEEIRRRILATPNPIPREFVEKWAERLREWATDENSTLKLAENIIQIMLHELGHRIEGE